MAHQSAGPQGSFSATFMKPSAPMLPVPSGDGVVPESNSPPTGGERLAMRRPTAEKFKQVTIDPNQAGPETPVSGSIQPTLSRSGTSSSSGYKIRSPGDSDRRGPNDRNQAKPALKYVIQSPAASKEHKQLPLSFWTSFSNSESPRNGNSARPYHPTYNIDDSSWLCTLAVNSSGQKKMLWYDLTRLVKVGGIVSMLCEGTVFTMDRQLLTSCIINVLLFVMSAVLQTLTIPDEKELAELSTESIEQLTTYINSFLPFVLALYVSLTLQRWWALRVQALGQLFNALSNTVMIMSCTIPGEQFAGAREQVEKLGMASIMLLLMAARGKDNSGSLISDGLLTAEEVKSLEGVGSFQRAATMWVWILRLTDQAFKLVKAPAPRFAALMSRAMQARDGIQTIHTYLETQLPFAYVHLITLLVNLQNIVVSIKAGIVFAVARANGDSQQMANQIFMCILVCVIYQGLLIISYVVHDPFGEDLLDFPVVAYTEYVAMSCSAMEKAQGTVPKLQYGDDEGPTPSVHGVASSQSAQSFHLDTHCDEKSLVGVMKAQSREIANLSKCIQVLVLELAHSRGVQVEFGIEELLQRHASTSIDRDRHEDDPAEGEGEGGGGGEVDGGDDGDDGGGC